MQLNKFLSQAGICSRRKAVEHIKMGMVAINGAVVKEPGYRVKGTDKVFFNGKLMAQEKKRYILMNKPKDYICTANDERDRRTVFDLLPRTINERLHTVGRLDRNSTGLLILTNDGELTERLAHPRNNVVKKYCVTLDKLLVYEDRKKLIEGVRLDGDWVKADAVEAVKDSWREVYISLHSGKYHVIRRMFELLGYSVLSLDRVKISFLSKRGLLVGCWRILTQEEITKLRTLAG